MIEPSRAGELVLDPQDTFRTYKAYCIRRGRRPCTAEYLVTMQKTVQEFEKILSGIRRVES